MERLSNYAASSTEVSNGMLYSWLQSSNRGTDDDFMLQVLPEFLQVEASLIDEPSGLVVPLRVQTTAL